MFMVFNSEICLFNMCSGGCAGCISFRVIKRVSVLIGLKLTRQSLAHFVIFSRSEFVLQCQDFPLQ